VEKRAHTAPVPRRGASRRQAADGFESELRADLVMQSESFVRADNFQKFEGFTNVDLRASIRKGPVNLQLFVNNLFDNATPVAGVRFFDSVNFSVSSPYVTGASRRQFGASLGYRF
jgi:hypothetical protein